MRLKFLFFIFVLLLAGIMALLFGISYVERGMLFYVCEGIVLFTGCFLVYFYCKVIKPLNSIGNGMELLKEQDFNTRLAEVGQYEADRIVQVFNRMMEQLKDERLRLREQNHFLDLLVSVSPMGVIILDFDGHISLLNAAALRFLGCEKEQEVLNRKLTELHTPLAEALARLRRDTVDTVRLSDAMIYRCSRLSFVDRGFAHPFLLIESLTAEVMKAEKKAYEKVIRMIAHEVNNSVAGITSTLDSVNAALETVDDTGDLREVMRVCIERCYSMSRFITRFADVVKIPDPDLRPTDLNACVTSCKQFMENLCRERGVGLHLNLCAHAPQVKMDIVLFEQVLVNILKNAVESIENQGDIYITTTASPPCIEVADTGKGITEEVAQKLFSPFFSTKPKGQGIGLVFVREVLLKHGCTFSLRTYDDGLTRFRIEFGRK